MTRHRDLEADLHVVEVVVAPQGADLSTVEGVETCRDFLLHVKWCGPRGEGPRASGGYSVSARGGFYELSRTGKWEMWVPKFRRWQFRWATIEEALAVARENVEIARLVNGWTYSEYREWAEERKATAG